MRTIALLTAVGGLGALTGCGFAAGMVWGDERFGDGHMPWAEADMSAQGTSVVCVGSDADLSDAQLAEGHFELRGTVVSTGVQPAAGFDNVHGCWTEPNTSLTLRTTEGDQWVIGYAWFEAEGWDNTPWADIWEGEVVDLTVGFDAGGEAAGFAVFRDSDHLVYAMESGRDGEGLQNGDIPGFEVQVDEVVGELDTDCGVRQALSVEYETDEDRLVLFPAEDGGFTFRAQDYTACNINSYAVEQSSCDDDTSYENSYVLFDRAPDRGVD